MLSKEQQLSSASIRLLPGFPLLLASAFSPKAGVTGEKKKGTCRNLVEYFATSGQKEFRETRQIGQGRHQY